MQWRPPSGGRYPRQRRWQGGGLAIGFLLVAVFIASVRNTHGPGALSPGHPVPGAGGDGALFAGITQRGSTLGARGAPVTLVIFGDLQSPTCAQFARSTLPELVRAEVRSGRLRLEFRPLSLIGTDSARAARMALALGQQGRLWQFVDLFYLNQRTQNTGYVTDARLRALAGALPAADVDLAMTRRAALAVTVALADARAQAERLRIATLPSFLLGRSDARLVRFRPQNLKAGSLLVPIRRLLGEAAGG
jgi:hypothetical protein